MWKEEYYNEITPIVAHIITFRCGYMREYLTQQPTNIRLWYFTNIFHQCSVNIYTSCVSAYVINYMFLHPLFYIIRSWFQLNAFRCVRHTLVCKTSADEMMVKLLMSCAEQCAEQVVASNYDFITLKIE